MAIFCICCPSAHVDGLVAAQARPIALTRLQCMRSTKGKVQKYKLAIPDDLPTAAWGVSGRAQVIEEIRR